jgi:hypothetical protein
MKEIESKTSIVLNGILFPVEFLNANDMKYTLNLYGLNAANADYCCTWCEKHKKDFANVFFVLFFLLKLTVF